MDNIKNILISVFTYLLPIYINRHMKLQFVHTLLYLLFQKMLTEFLLTIQH
jgi:hypothetical protein